MRKEGGVFLQFKRLVSCQLYRDGSYKSVRDVTPYSPDLNPIEQMWGKIKNCLRKESARTLDKFAISIKVAFMSIQSTDLANWYGHCGYRTL